MITGLLLLGIAAIPTVASDTFLANKKDVYVLSPSTYLGRFGVAVKWSRDSRQIVFQTGDVNTSFSAIRSGLSATGQYQTKTSDIVRFDTGSGRSQVIASIADNLYLGNIDLVGPGGDTVFEVRKVVPEGGQFVQVWFAPEGRPGKSITDWIPSNSSSLICSKGLRAAFFANMSGTGLTVDRISPVGFEPILPPGKWEVGSFTANTKDGGAVIAVSRKAKGLEPTFDALRLDYQTRAVVSATSVKIDFEVPDALPRPFDLKRFATPAPVGFSPGDKTYDLLFADRAPKPRQLLIAGGTYNGIELSPDGLSITYSTSDGFFLRQLVKVSAAVAERLNPPK